MIVMRAEEGDKREPLWFVLLSWYDLKRLRREGGPVTVPLPGSGCPGRVVVLAGPSDDKIADMLSDASKVWLTKKRPDA